MITPYLPNMIKMKVQKIIIRIYYKSTIKEGYILKDILLHEVLKNLFVKTM